mmetsp:Transcript_67002/g.139642  ORF Transcript_67002/g.139642 Transcript_67002/m.139642 type:complete len:412 (+) Transcript_67002:436-1671(+)
MRARILSHGAVHAPQPQCFAITPRAQCVVLHHLPLLPRGREHDSQLPFPHCREHLPCERCALVHPSTRILLVRVPLGARVALPLRRGEPRAEVGHRLPPLVLRRPPRRIMPLRRCTTTVLAVPQGVPPLHAPLVPPRRRHVRPLGAGSAGGARGEGAEAEGGRGRDRVAWDSWHDGRAALHRHHHRHRHSPPPQPPPLPRVVARLRARRPPPRRRLRLPPLLLLHLPRPHLPPPVRRHRATGGSVASGIHDAVSSLHALLLGGGGGHPRPSLDPRALDGPGHIRRVRSGAVRAGSCGEQVGGPARHRLARAQHRRGHRQHQGLVRPAATGTPGRVEGSAWGGEGGRGEAARIARHCEQPQAQGSVEQGGGCVPWEERCGISRPGKVMGSGRGLGGQSCQWAHNLKACNLKA